MANSQAQLNFADKIFQLFQTQKRTEMPLSQLKPLYWQRWKQDMSLNEITDLPFVRIDKESNNNDPTISIVIELDDCCNHCKYQYCKLLHSVTPKDICPEFESKEKCSKANCVLIHRPKIRLIQRVKDIISDSGTKRLRWSELLSEHSRRYPRLEARHQPTSHGVKKRFRKTFIVDYDSHLKESIISLKDPNRQRDRGNPTMPLNSDRKAYYQQQYPPQIQQSRPTASASVAIRPSRTGSKMSWGRLPTAPSSSGSAPANSSSPAAPAPTATMASAATLPPQLKAVNGTAPESVSSLAVEARGFSHSDVNSSAVIGATSASSVPSQQLHQPQSQPQRQHHNAKKHSNKSKQSKQNKHKYMPKGGTSMNQDTQKESHNTAYQNEETMNHDSSVNASQQSSVSHHNTSKSRKSGDIIPEQTDLACLHVTLKKEWSDPDLVKDLVRHISSKTSKHVCDAYIPDRQRMGFFTAASADRAGALVERSYRSTVRCHGRSVQIDVVSNPKGRTFPPGRRLRVRNVNCILGKKEFHRWCDENSGGGVSDVEIVFPMVKRGSDYALLLFFNRGDADTVVQSLTNVPFRSYPLKFRHWIHPNASKPIQSSVSLRPKNPASPSRSPTRVAVSGARVATADNDGSIDATDRNKSIWSQFSKSMNRHQPKPTVVSPVSPPHSHQPTPVTVSNMSSTTAAAVVTSSSTTTQTSSSASSTTQTRETDNLDTPATTTSQSSVAVTPPATINTTDVTSSPANIAHDTFKTTHEMGTSTEPSPSHSNSSVAAQQQQQQQRRPPTHPTKPPHSATKFMTSPTHSTTPSVGENSSHPLINGVESKPVGDNQPKKPSVPPMKANYFTTPAAAATTTVVNTATTAVPTVNTALSPPVSTISPPISTQQPPIVTQPVVQHTIPQQPQQIASPLVSPAMNAMQQQLFQAQQQQQQQQQYQANTATNSAAVVQQQQQQQQNNLQQQYLQQFLLQQYNQYQQLRTQNPQQPPPGMHNLTNALPLAVQQILQQPHAMNPSMNPSMQQTMAQQIAQQMAQSQPQPVPHSMTQPQMSTPIHAQPPHQPSMTQMQQTPLQQPPPPQQQQQQQQTRLPNVIDSTSTPTPMQPQPQSQQPTPIQQQPPQPQPQPPPPQQQTQVSSQPQPQPQPQQQPQQQSANVDFKTVQAKLVVQQNGDITRYILYIQSDTSLDPPTMKQLHQTLFEKLRQQGVTTAPEMTYGDPPTDLPSQLVIITIPEYRQPETPVQQTTPTQNIPASVQPQTAVSPAQPQPQPQPQQQSMNTLPPPQTPDSSAGHRTPQSLEEQNRSTRRQQPMPPIQTQTQTQNIYTQPPQINGHNTNPMSQPQQLSSPPQPQRVSSPPNLTKPNKQTLSALKAKPYTPTNIQQYSVTPPTPGAQTNTGGVSSPIPQQTTNQTYQPTAVQPTPTAQTIPTLPQSADLPSQPRAQPYASAVSPQHASTQPIHPQPQPPPPQSQPAAIHPFPHTEAPILPFLKYRKKRSGNKICRICLSGQHPPSQCWLAEIPEKKQSSASKQASNNATQHSNTTHRNSNTRNRHKNRRNKPVSTASSAVSSASSQFPYNNSANPANNSSASNNRRKQRSSQPQSSTAQSSQPQFDSNNTNHNTAHSHNNNSSGNRKSYRAKSHRSGGNRS